ncbi:unnamed protein product, partial [Mesorhabditis belari]|uniref:Methylosome subunit pICln n=1 Tax=Mesorhabditis belari TaxID=2138241 RepID=A0AAF3F494_9BILA
MVVLTDVTLPTEGVRIQQPQVSAYFGENCVGQGTLTIAESAVAWVERTSGKGFTLTYPSIILHAVSTDCSSFPHECVFVLVDCSRSALELEDTEMDGDDDDEDEGPKNVSIRFVPADMSILQEVYKQMSECQELNPEDNSDSEDGMGEYEGLGDGSDGRWFTADNIGGAELSEEGLANLQRMMGGGRDGHNGSNGHDDDEHGEMEE